MNIFVLDNEPEYAARFHCDSHVSKMTLETAQLLCTALHQLGIPAPYKSTHLNHPCSKWIRESRENYKWLWALGYELHKEFQFRFGKTHKSGLVIESLPVNTTFPATPMTPFAQAMPVEYQGPDAVQAYRNYYMAEKAHLLIYTERESPWWLK